MCRPQQNCFCHCLKIYRSLPLPSLSPHIPRKRNSNFERGFIDPGEKITFAIEKLELKLPDSNSLLSATIDTDLPEVQENDRSSATQKQKLKQNSPKREHNLIIFGLSESSEGTS